MSCAPKLTELLYTPMTKLTYNTQKHVYARVMCEKMSKWPENKTLYGTRNWKPHKSSESVMSAIPYN